MLRLQRFGARAFRTPVLLTRSYAVDFKVAQEAKNAPSPASTANTNTAATATPATGQPGGASANDTGSTSTTSLGQDQPNSNSNSDPINDTVPAEKMTGIGESHATNPQDSVVPEALQKAVPKAAERVLPEAVHPTEGKK